MSNLEASKNYELIVESVINEVREDFENAGIDESTLQDLKKVWQKKLTEYKVANFSWDSQLDDAHLVTSNATNAANGNSASTENQEAGAPSEYSLKEESQGLVLPGFISDNNVQGTVAPANEVNSGTSDNTQNIPATNLDSVNGDSATKEERNIEITINTNDANININNTTKEENNNGMKELKQEEKTSKRSALLDNDEVGSELDDSDDDYLISENDDEGPDENLVLCLYEKVTRTKARWKCSLKDGIATINRKDFTFQKAQVEAEWV